MELSVRVLCRDAIAPGFELAGLSVDRAEPDESAVVALRQLANDPSVGLVLIEERLQRSLPDDLVEQLEERASPIVVPFPSPAWDERSLAEEYVLAILRQAVGYRVRVR